MASGQISTRPDAAGSPWLVKFPAQGEHQEVCAIEQCYAELARECGLETPRAAGLKCRPNWRRLARRVLTKKPALRVPVHSLAGLLHIDFRLPGAADYTTFSARDPPVDA